MLRRSCKKVIASPYGITSHYRFTPISLLRQNASSSGSTTPKKDDVSKKVSLKSNMRFVKEQLHR